MKRMKVLVSLLLVILLQLCSCGISKDNTIASAWDELHNSNFSYVETQISLDEHGNTTRLVIEGECTTEPYIVTQEIVEGDVIWSESYIYKVDDAYKCVLMQNGVWQEAEVAQDDPIFEGYEGRNSIKILSKEEKSLDGISYDVYKTEYETIVGEEYELEETVTATVSQEYYMNKDTGKIERINTDSSNLVRAYRIAAYMYMNDETIEDAAKRADEQASEATVEVEITYLADDYVLEIPEVSN